MASAAGADVVIDRHRADLADQILAATGGLGVDRIVEVALGTNLALDERIITNGGVIAAYASDADPEPRLPFWPLLFKNVMLRLVGSDDLPVAAEGAAVEDISQCLAEGRLRPVVAQCFPLERIAEAHDLVEQGGQAGHILIDIGADTSGGDAARTALDTDRRDHL
jgi:NADPH2:quinone reductase